MGYKGLEDVSRGCQRLTGITKGYKELEAV